MVDHTTKCVVIGAGPVGALAALYAAQRGWDVEVYELRGDLRDASTTPLNFTKSINLALSERGINAMRHSGSQELLDTVLSETIPMHGRMIHSADASGNLKEESQEYDVHGRAIQAVDRGSLNTHLLDELERHPNVKLFFHHKLTGVDYTARKAWLEQRPPKSAAPATRAKEIERQFDLIIGCDGAHSSVRYHMMKYVRMDYSQSYIDCLWCEFTIPAVPPGATTASLSAKAGFATSPNHLHIWPSGEDMMFIAIPSSDKTFTCTLFAPAATFAALEAAPSSLPTFFTQNFPGALPLIGTADSLISQFTTNPHLPLISIKSAPHHHTHAGVILGDAAHAMVPFYGQGMNAGLEDVRVLFSHLSSRPPTPAGRAEALQAYSAERVSDAHTINDLALDNYWEMHAGVRAPGYLIRKWVEEGLERWMPVLGVRTQYGRVSFSNQRYSEVRRDVRWQGWVLGGLLSAGMVGLVGSLAGWLMLRQRAGRAVAGNQFSEIARFVMDGVRNGLARIGL